MPTTNIGPCNCCGPKICGLCLFEGGEPKFASLTISDGTASAPMTFNFSTFRYETTTPNVLCTPFTESYEPNIIWGIGCQDEDPFLGTNNFGPPPGHFVSTLLTSWECAPFEATFTVEYFPSGKVCTFTVTE